jgi:hypothetical protein
MGYIDHQWEWTDGHYKCLLCGAISLKRPAQPTPAKWEADRYELPLSEEERTLSANHRGFKRVL